MTFELRDAGDPNACVLSFGHVGVPAGNVAPGWERFLTSLTRLVETGDGEPYGSATDALHAARTYHHAWTSRDFDAALSTFGSLVHEVDLLAEFSGGNHALLLYDMHTDPFGTIRVAEHFTVADGLIRRIGTSTTPSHCAAPDDPPSVLRGTSRPSPERGARGRGRHWLRVLSGPRVNGKIFAMLVADELVVKLPATRCAQLVSAGAARPFDRGQGRPLKEWVMVSDEAEQAWPDLAQEALAFAGPAGTSGPEPGCVTDPAGTSPPAARLPRVRTPSWTGLMCC